MILEKCRNLLKYWKLRHFSILWENAVCVIGKNPFLLSEKTFSF